MKGKRVVVINNKGGVGKSTLAYSIALEKGYLFITNEPRSPALQIFEKNHALILDGDESLDNLKNSLDVVFDFKGNTQGRLVLEALNQASKVIVPIVYRDEDDIFPMEESIYSIREIEQINKNIVIVANDIQSHKEFETLKVQVERFFDYPVLRLNRAKLFPRSIRKSQGVTHYLGDDRLLRSNYRNAVGQFNEILKII